MRPHLTSCPGENRLVPGLHPLSDPEEVTDEIDEAVAVAEHVEDLVNVLTGWIGDLAGRVTSAGFPSGATWEVIEDAVAALRTDADLAWLTETVRDLRTDVAGALEDAAADTP